MFLSVEWLALIGIIFTTFLIWNLRLTYKVNYYKAYHDTINKSYFNFPRNTPE